MCSHGFQLISNGSYNGKHVEVYGPALYGPFQVHLNQASENTRMVLQHWLERSGKYIPCETPKIAIDSVQLVHITPITMVCGTYNYSYWGL